MTSIQNRFERASGGNFSSSRGGSQRDNRANRAEGGGSRFEDLQKAIESRRGRGRGRGGREEVDPTAPVVSTQPVPTPQTPAPPVTTTPPPVATTPPNSSDGSVLSLAEKYVDNYSQQTGKSLSTATRDALVKDVASFYGENGSRTDRLRTLVGVF